MDALILVCVGILGYFFYSLLIVGSVLFVAEKITKIRAPGRHAAVLAAVSAGISICRFIMTPGPLLSAGAGAGATGVPLVVAVLYAAIYKGNSKDKVKKPATGQIQQSTLPEVKATADALPSELKRDWRAFSLRVSARRV